MFSFEEMKESQLIDTVDYFGSVYSKYSFNDLGEEYERLIKGNLECELSQEEVLKKIEIIEEIYINQ